jgi:hypothetical protein
MDWMPVYGSSNVIGMKYDEAKQDCYVRFTDGTVYSYHNVTPEKWEEFVHAPSKGKFVNLVFRRGYKYDRVHGAEEIPGEEKKRDSEPAGD